MSEETKVTPPGSLAEPVDMIQETMDKFLATADVTAVYGEPVAHGDTVIIPTAEVLSVMGFGLGYGQGTDTENQTGSGGGGGGGGRVLSRPVAVIIASPEGVRVEPVFDITKILLAGLTAAGFMVGMVARMSRRPRI